MSAKTYKSGGLSENNPATASYPKNPSNRDSVFDSHKERYMFLSHDVLAKGLECGFICCLELSVGRGGKAGQISRLRELLNNVIEDQRVETVVGYGKPINPETSYGDKTEEERLRLRVNYRPDILLEAMKSIYERMSDSAKEGRLGNYVKDFLHVAEQSEVPFDQLFKSYNPLEKDIGVHNCLKGHLLEVYFETLFKSNAPECSVRTRAKYMSVNGKIKAQAGDVDCMVAMPKMDFVRALKKLEASGDIKVLSYPINLDFTLDELKEDLEDAA